MTSEHVALSIPTDVERCQVVHHIEVQIPVSVQVRQCEAGVHSRRQNPRLLGRIAKGTVAVIAISAKITKIADDKVAESVRINVTSTATDAEILVAQRSGFRHVLKTVSR